MPDMTARPSILIIGGAGYIGSHLANVALLQGYHPIIVDNLSSGYAESVAECELICADFQQQEVVRNILETRDIYAIFHLAGVLNVAESVQHPALYYQENVAGMIRLLEVIRHFPTIPFIFSSSAAVYGAPSYLPMDEAHPMQPVNPYGHSKRMVEQILADYHAAYGMRYSCLRYFNAAGAMPDGSNGERHDPETHLIPRLMQAASGRLKHIALYGTDYATPDGSCVRDYVHVLDLASAHLLVADALSQCSAPLLYNLGTGKGISVKELLHHAEYITQRSIPHQWEVRRAGDPPILIADGSAIRKELGWQPSYSACDIILRHAWQWEQQLLLLKQ